MEEAQDRAAQWLRSADPQHVRAEGNGVELRMTARAYRPFVINPHSVGNHGWCGPFGLGYDMGCSRALSARQCLVIQPTAISTMPTASMNGWLYWSAHAAPWAQVHVPIGQQIEELSDPARNGPQEERQFQRPPSEPQFVVHKRSFRFLTRRRLSWLDEGARSTGCRNIVVYFQSVTEFKASPGG